MINKTKRRKHIRTEGGKETFPKALSYIFFYVRETLYGLKALSV